MNIKKTSIVVFIISIIVYCFISWNKIRVLLPHSFPYVNVKSKTIPAKHTFPEKKWLHRVNSIDRARFMQNKYIGFEIDVNFDTSKGYFDVYHLPAPSINLSFEMLLQSFNNPGSLYFWLDFKNLCELNKNRALQHLVYLANKYDIKNNIIVESSNPEMLTEFTSSGFYTSYYIPAFNPYEISDSTLEAYINEIDRRLCKSKVNALSGEYIQYPVLRQYFSNSDFLFYQIDNSHHLFKYIVRKMIIANKNVKVFLVSEKSSGYQ